MILIEQPQGRFQLRAAAIVIEEGRVLVHRAAGDRFWTIPGGRVEIGEDAPATVVREMFEELGENVECGELLFLVENFFCHAGGRHHEVGMYFRVRLASDSPLRGRCDRFVGSEPDKALEYAWIDRFCLNSLPLYPEALRDALSGQATGFRHFVERGPGARNQRGWGAMRSSKSPDAVSRHAG